MFDLFSDIGLIYFLNILSHSFSVSPVKEFTRFLGVAWSPSFCRVTGYSFTFLLLAAIRSPFRVNFGVPRRRHRDGSRVSTLFLVLSVTVPAPRSSCNSRPALLPRWRNLLTVKEDFNCILSR